MNVLLVADTHLRAGQEHRLADRLDGLLDAADVIVHAGDIIDPAVLEMLADHAPVHAVLGNNDRGMVLPERVELDLDGCRVAVVHDSGPSTGRASRLRRWFPDADVVVFGHSHLPWHEVDVRTTDGHAQHHINPGSAMQRRSAPHHTAALLHVQDGSVVHVTHVALP